MPQTPRIRVSSNSFSRNPILRDELIKIYPHAIFHDDDHPLKDGALAKFLSDADGAIVGREWIDATLLRACPQLKIVSKYGVGLDNIDADACQASHVVVGWTAGVNRRSVAELTLCFMLGLSRNIFQTSQQLRNSKWKKDGGMQLTDRTVGIVGLGNIGKEVVRLLQPIGCKILINDIEVDEPFCTLHKLQSVDKPSLYTSCDVISLHVPLTPLTKNMIDEVSLSTMKPTAYLINTSRGEVVDERALKYALQHGIIAGAALDVFREEPPSDLELLSLPNLVATPHIGANAFEAVLAMGRSAIHHLNDYFNTAVGSNS